MIPRVSLRKENRLSCIFLPNKLMQGQGKVRNVYNTLGLKFIICYYTVKLFSKYNLMNILKYFVSRLITINNMLKTKVSDINKKKVISLYNI